MEENEYLCSPVCILGRNRRMPSSENSSPTIDVMKRLVAQLTSCLAARRLLYMIR